MAAKRSSTKIPVSQVAATLDGGVQGADQARAVGLGGLQRVRLARANGMQRERDRLAARHGATDPRVASLTKAIEADQALTRRVSLEVTRANTQAPQVDAASWIVFGYVLDAKFAGVPNVRVVPCDADGAEVKGMNAATTDTAGFFKLVQPAGPKGAGRLDAASPDPAGNLAEQAFLRVDDSQGKTLVRDPRPLQPAAGHTDYREIVVESSDGKGVARPVQMEQPPSPPTAAPTTAPVPGTPAPPPAKKVGKPASGRRQGPSGKRSGGG